MTSPVVDTDFENAVATVATYMRQLQQFWDAIVQGVNLAIDVLPGFLAERARVEFHKLEKEVDVLFTKMWRFWSERGSAGAIRTAAGDWNAQVGGVAANQAGRLVAHQLPSTGLWTGTAATKYGQVVLGQNKALVEVKTITDNLQTTLNEYAAALTDYWHALARTYGGHLVALAACVVGVGTGVGAVPALVAAVTATSAAIWSVDQAETDLTNALDAKEAKLEQLLTSDASFSDGSWPPVMTGALADSNVRDGDRSEWTPA